MTRKDGPVISQYALYRYFDVPGRLLYVGKSGDLAARGKAHIRSSHWMQFAARSTIERHDSPEALSEAERVAIQAEGPVFNLQYNDTPEARERLRAYLEEAGRLDLMPARKAPPVRRAPEPGGVSEDLLEEITAIREAFDRANAAALASSDAEQGFRDVSAVGDLIRQMISEAASLRAHSAARLADAGALSITQLASMLGVSRSRAAQFVTAGRKGGTRARAATVPQEAREGTNLAPSGPVPAFQPGDQAEIIKPGWKWTPVVTVHGSSSNAEGVITSYYTDGCTDPHDWYIFQPEDLRLISRPGDST